MCARGQRRGLRRRACRAHAAFEELEAQAALAVPASAPRRPPAHCPRPSARRHLERAQIRRPSTKRQRPRARECRSACAPHRSDEPVDAHHLGDALDAKLARSSSAEVATDQRRVAASGSTSRARRALPCAARAQPYGPARVVMRFRSSADPVRPRPLPELIPMRVEKPTPCSRFTSVR